MRFNLWEDTGHKHWVFPYWYIPAQKHSSSSKLRLNSLWGSSTCLWYAECLQQFKVIWNLGPMIRSFRLTFQLPFKEQGIKAQSRDWGEMGQNIFPFYYLWCSSFKCLLDDHLSIYCCFSVSMEHLYGLQQVKCQKLSLTLKVLSGTQYWRICLHILMIKIRHFFHFLYFSVTQI